MKIIFEYIPQYPAVNVIFCEDCGQLGNYYSNYYQINKRIKIQRSTLDYYYCGVCANNLQNRFTAENPPLQFNLTNNF